MTGALVALAVAGCSSGDGPAAEEEAEMGPISRMMQEAYGEPDEQQMVDQQAQVEDLVAACMAEQGFEYTPVDTSGQSFVVPEDGDVPEWGSVEFAERFGYGMTTSDELAEAQGYDPSVEEEMPVNPNDERVMAMGEGEQQAYYEALYGVQTGTTSEDEPVEYDWTTAGCSGAAQHEVFEVEVEGTDTQDLQTRLGEIYEDAQQDPRYRTAQQEWATCMGDEGHDFTAPEDAQQSISDDLNAMWEASTTGEVDEAVEADLREREIAVAVADAGCREGADLDGVLGQVTSDLEETFYAENKAEVDAWVAAMQEKNGS
ncbi:hypothetical protein [Cellulomonas endophytica]|uniref:hypothetical protein n=1 Tax=Cellulomonas endophytica TaxID=2494735 RepID=UPI001010AEE6|nr:hypothetical protein [Cellulomonas endophytica]